MCPKMRPVGVSKKGKKRTETFMRQTGYLPIQNGVNEGSGESKMRATKLVPGNYYTPQVQRETSEIKITNITVQKHLVET